MIMVKIIIIMMSSLIISGGILLMMWIGEHIIECIRHYKISNLKINKDEA